MTRKSTRKNKQNLTRAEELAIYNQTRRESVVPLGFNYSAQGRLKKKDALSTHSLAYTPVRTQCGTGRLMMLSDTIKKNYCSAFIHDKKGGQVFQQDVQTVFDGSSIYSGWLDMCLDWTARYGSPRIVYDGLTKKRRDVVVVDIDVPYTTGMLMQLRNAYAHSDSPPSFLTFNRESSHIQIGYLMEPMDMDGANRDAYIRLVRLAALRFCDIMHRGDVVRMERFGTPDPCFTGALSRNPFSETQRTWFWNNGWFEAGKKGTYAEALAQYDDVPVYAHSVLTFGYTAADAHQFVDRIGRVNMNRASQIAELAMGLECGGRREAMDIGYHVVHGIPVSEVTAQTLSALRNNAGLSRHMSLLSILASECRRIERLSQAVMTADETLALARHLALSVRSLIVKREPFPDDEVSSIATSVFKMLCSEPTDMSGARVEGESAYGGMYAVHNWRMHCAHMSRIYANENVFEMFVTRQIRGTEAMRRVGMSMHAFYESLKEYKAYKRIVERLESERHDDIRDIIRGEDKKLADDCRTLFELFKRTETVENVDGYGRVFSAERLPYGAYGLSDNAIDDINLTTRRCCLMKTMATLYAYNGLMKRCKFVETDVGWLARQNSNTLAQTLVNTRTGRFQQLCGNVMALLKDCQDTYMAVCSNPIINVCY